MSLNLALQGAVSGIRANQQAIALLTQNITNANSEGYTRQIIQQSQQIVGGVGAGVRVESVQRAVDQFLVTASRQQGARVGTQQAKVDYLGRVQFLYGQPGAGNDLKTIADNFFGTLRDLSTNPEQAFTRSQTVRNGDFLANQVSTLAQSLYQTQFDVDQEVSQVVNDINQTLDKLYDTNLSIKTTKANGGVNSGVLNALYDTRDQALKELSANIDISTIFQADGTVSIFTLNGNLLDENRYHLTYEPQRNVQDFIDGRDISPIKVSLLDVNGNLTDSTRTLVTGGAAGTLSTEIKQGRLVGLIETRDITLKRQIDQLDEFAYQYINKFNAIHNKGVGFPPPQSLTGQRPISTIDEHVFTGKTMIAPLTPDGKPISSPYASETYFRPYTLDFSTIQGPTGQGSPSVADITRDINAYFTPGNRAQLGNMTDMKLAAISNNIAVDGTFDFDFDFDNNTGTDAVVQVTGVSSPDAGITFSAVPATLAAGVTVPAGQRLRTGLGQDITADFSLAAGPGPHLINVDILVDGVPSTIQYTVAENVTDIRNNRYSASAIAAGTATIETPSTVNPLLTANVVDEDGNIVTSGNGFLRLKGANSNIRVAVDELTSQEGGTPGNAAATATGFGFSNYFELNNFFNTNNNTIEHSALNMSVQQRILDNVGLLSTGALSASISPDGSPLYTYETAVSSADTVQQLADLQFDQVDFNEAGTIPAVRLTLGGYLSEVIAYAGQEQSNAEDSLSKEQVIQQALDERLDSTRGVNIDEELANSVLFQNAYNATARMISIVDELFKTLIEST